MSRRATTPSMASEAVRRKTHKRTSDRNDVASPHTKIVKPVQHTRHARLMGLFSGGAFTPAAERLVDWLNGLAVAKLDETILRIQKLLPLLGTVDEQAEQLIRAAVNMSSEDWTAFAGKITTRHAMSDALATFAPRAAEEPEEDDFDLDDDDYDDEDEEDEDDFDDDEPVFAAKITDLSQLPEPTAADLAEMDDELRAMFAERGAA